MVVALGPGKFYGSSLPRPRFYTDVTFNSERVDPPVSVMDPFLSWAREAHWSMGGLNTQRVRFQGRIEGNINRLRKFREKQIKLTPRNDTPEKDPVTKGGKKKHRAGSPSPPPAPRVTKKRKFMDLFDDEDEDEEEEQMGVDKSERGRGKKWPVRKLAGEFERVAKETEVKKKVSESESIGRRTRSNGMEKGSGGIAEELSKEVSEGKKKSKKRLRKAGEDSRSVPADEGKGSSVRTSPRLAKQKST